MRTELWEPQPFLQISIQEKTRCHASKAKRAQQRGVTSRNITLITIMGSFATLCNIVISGKFDKRRGESKLQVASRRGRHCSKYPGGFWNAFTRHCSTIFVDSKTIRHRCSIQRFIHLVFAIVGLAELYSFILSATLTHTHTHTHYSRFGD